MSGKESLADPAAGVDQPHAAGQIDILPPIAVAALADAVTAVQRLARAHLVPEALLAALDGPLGEAVATAAEYAGSALSEATKRAYGRDWFHFADWSRQQGVDPTTCRSTRCWWRLTSPAWPRL